MSDESELARLRADLEAIERVGMRYRAYVCNGDIRDDIRKRIAELEAAADPWREAKCLLGRYRGSQFDPGKMVAYVDHLTAENARLTARVAELEAENATREELEDDYYNVSEAAKQAYEGRGKAVAPQQPPFLDGEPEFTPAVLKRADEVVAGDVILAGDRIQTVTEIDSDHPSHPNKRIIKCDGWMAWFDNHDITAVLRKPLVESKTVADMQPPFEGPIVGFDPVLEPNRVLATAVEALAIRRLAAQTRDRLTTLCNNAKPYPLKKGGE